MSAGNREHYKGSHLSITQVDEIFVNLGDVLKHKQQSTYPATLLSSSGLLCKKCWTEDPVIGRLSQAENDISE
jgi:hypothetical protein